MKKRHFFTGYIMSWLVLVIWSGYQAGAFAVIAINLLFVCINLIGTYFATGCHVPWRDNDPRKSGVCFACGKSPCGCKS